MSKKDKERAFNDWWTGDSDDEPITDVSKKRAKEIFLAGYAFGSRKPVYEMSASQYQAMVKMIKEKHGD